MKAFLYLRNITLFILAYLSIFIYGKRNKISKNPKKILVIQLAKLGDMVCFTPVLHALRQSMPGVKICVMGDSINEKILEGNKDFDKYIVFDEKRIFQLIKLIKNENVDVAIMRGTNFVSLAITLIAGVPSVIAPEVHGGMALETRTYKLLLPFVHRIILKFGQYMPREFLHLLEPLDIYTDDTSKHLSFSTEASKKISEIFNTHNIDPKKEFLVGVSPSAGNIIKEWPADRFAKVIDHLRDNHNAKIFLLAGPKEQEQVNRVIENLKNMEKLINLQGQLNIDELKAFISKLNLFIAVDTGPIYIAEAFGVPTIDIVGPMDEREQPPIGLKHFVLVPKREKPQLHIMNARIYDKKEAIRQAQATSAEEVILLLDRILPL